MGDWFDKERIICLNCGHKWILRSDDWITNKQHYDWLVKVAKEDEKIHETEEEE